MDIRIIIRIDNLIMNEMTGSPKQLASKLAITERSVYNYIAFMKRELKAPIVYNYQRLSYVYNDEWDFKFNIK
ncbi:MAG: HTH domain-containing protein [Bacteroidia bacterium]|nr:HTH domain-containing protein [Bacteroidia bacterium]